ncbi:unannotated protein [freshwater metagenome]|uniref:Unannotated protein n=1 Tax=freshwater metagenome TaxID=449393 RepID=A0A6J7U666_9ZZZZ|nr:hypothetical protein [Actinomycetota bacterium]MTH92963.1 hypothetical protein [Actinomycetota bacterium]
MKKRALLGLCAVAVLSSCATTYNSGANAPATTAPSASTTTTIPRGSTEELFAQMLQTGKELGNDVAQGDMSIARTKLADITAIWIGIQPQITQASQDLVDDTQRMINLFTTAVERKRPADADKAMRFLPSLISSLVN